MTFATGRPAWPCRPGVELKVEQEMLGHSSIVPTTDTYTSVLPDAAHAAAEKVAALIISAGCLVPGTQRRRRRQARRKPRRAGHARRSGQPRQDPEPATGAL
jgi:hypothetical protein